MRYSRVENRVKKADLSDPPISQGEFLHSSFTERLIDILSAAGYDYRKYSGRGMFGKSCVGVDLTDTRDLMGLTVGMAEVDPTFVEQLILLAKFDDMGRGMIIYWPKAIIEPTPNTPPATLDDAIEGGQGEL